MNCPCINNVACGLGMVSSRIRRAISVIEMEADPHTTHNATWGVHYRGPLSNHIFPGHRPKRLTHCLIDAEGKPIFDWFAPGAPDAWDVVQRVMPIVMDLEARARERCVFPADKASALEEVARLRERVGELETMLKGGAK